MALAISSSSDNTKYDLYIGFKDGVIANENSNYYFYNFQNIKSINFDDKFDTSNVMDMSYMFDWVFKLENIYVGPNYTTSNANTQHMLSSSDVSSVTTGHC